MISQIFVNFVNSLLSHNKIPKLINVVQFFEWNWNSSGWQSWRSVQNMRWNWIWEFWHHVLKNKINWLLVTLFFHSNQFTFLTLFADNWLCRIHKRSSINKGFKTTQEVTTKKQNQFCKKILDLTGCQKKNVIFFHTAVNSFERLNYKNMLYRSQPTYFNCHKVSACITDLSKWIF